MHISEVVVRSSTTEYYTTTWAECTEYVALLALCLYTMSTLGIPNRACGLFSAQEFLGDKWGRLTLTDVFLGDSFPVHNLGGLWP